MRSTRWMFALSLAAAALPPAGCYRAEYEQKIVCLLTPRDEICAALDSREVDEKVARASYSPDKLISVDDGPIEAPYCPGYAGGACLSRERQCCYTVTLEISQEPRGIVTN